jgi:putative serine/threonine protein kinase
MELFARGKRGKVYLVSGKEFGLKKDVIVKKFDRVDRALNEAEFLLLLNKYGVGPELYLYGDDFVVMEFCDGVPVKDYTFGKDAKKIVNNVFLQCYIMDELKVNKLEMHKPVKHVIIGKKVWLIDFERCYYADKRKNVTQFAEYMVRLFKVDREGLLPLLRKYKKGYAWNDFVNVVEYVCSSL